MRVRTYMVSLFLLCFTAVWAEDSIPSLGAQNTEHRTQTDTLGAQIDSLGLDGLDSLERLDGIDSLDGLAELDSIDTLGTVVRADSTGVPVRRKPSSLAGPVHYQASDSMIMMGNGTAYLHGNGDLKYERMELKSAYIRMNVDSNLIYARGVYDSLNYEWVGRPVFTEGQDSYETSEITYNIKTQKGYIRRVVTQQGEGYIIADRTKKLQGDVMTMAGGQYTTCDDHDHPHFYLKLTKAKVKPGEYIASGPAYLVVGDVPLPVAIPFGFFPFTNSYSSGLIMPNFGDDYSRGLYLQNLGYYFAICDYMDLQVMGDIYTKGTWAIRATSKYVWRYHFNGSLNINYRNDVTGEKGLPDYAVNRNFQIQWTHTQDPKSNPYSTFSASVNFSTSGYSHSNINNYYNSELLSENTKSSNISYTQRFPDSPWSLSMSVNLSQRTKDSTISLTAPELAVNLSTVYPFKELRQAVLKKKGKVGGKAQWYEKISLRYSMNGKIAVNNIKEKDFLTSDFLRDWQTGLKHSMPVNASFTVFKYLNITPSINMTDRMYFTRIDRFWDNEAQALGMDTTIGFYNVFDFNVGVSMSTKLYGFYTPIKKLFPNSKVEKFRHVVTPTISFSYHPDFGSEGWGYWGSYEQPIYDGTDSITGRKIQKVDDAGNPVYEHKTYNRFSNGVYGSVGQGMSATLNFSLDNNLEMKVVNKDDTTGKNPYKVISLIDKFSITGGYNFAADSMNWSKFGVALRLKFPKLNNYTLNLSTNLDPYMYEIVNGTPRRTNKQYWNNGRFPHWSGFRWNFSYTFNNQTIKKWKDKAAGLKTKQNDDESPEEEDGITPVVRDGDGLVSGGKQKHDHETEVDDGYEKLEIPWSLTLSYSLAYADGRTFNYDKMQYDMEFTNSLTMNGNIGLGKGWKVSASMTYNFDYMKLTSCTFNISRDLHCWNMTASINPIGPYKSYTFHIGVNASILSDLKYDKNSNQSTNGRVTWW